MRYLEYHPRPPLSAYVDRLWYCEGYKPGHRFERLLPNGKLSIIVSLAQDRFPCWSAGQLAGIPEWKPASVVAGVYSVYSVIDTNSMDEMVGALFHAGGIRAVLGVPADEFTDKDTPLDSLWGGRCGEMRERLLAAMSPEAKMFVLESELRDRLCQTSTARGEVSFALQAFDLVPHAVTVAEVTRQTGLSPRRFAQVFREEVGVTPKLYCRIRRFQEAIQQIRAGAEVRWANVALDCGYFDQAHFVNDFRSFSGITPTTYLAGNMTWANHVALDL